MRRAVFAVAALVAAAMNDNIPTAAAGNEVQNGTLRERREERRIEEIPEPKPSDSRRANQRWRAVGTASRPAGGNNKGRMSVRFGPYLGPTRESVEERRHKEMDDWLHEAVLPPRPSKRQRVESVEPPVEAVERPKRQAAPTELGEASSSRGPKPGQGKAGSGCVASLRAGSTRASVGWEHTCEQRARSAQRAACARSAHCTALLHAAF